mmetsp:Transcript_36366/g.88082  ORF Transcript_36366/g.88082 Transcript_36366/m.88082 type:complete len:102 (-) Transcript_36366:36-341(-)
MIVKAGGVGAVNMAGTWIAVGAVFLCLALVVCMRREPNLHLCIGTFDFLIQQAKILLPASEAIRRILKPSTIAGFVVGCYVNTTVGCCPRLRVGNFDGWVF